MFPLRPFTTYRRSSIIVGRRGWSGSSVSVGGALRSSATDDRSFTNVIAKASLKQMIETSKGKCSL